MWEDFHKDLVKNGRYLLIVYYEDLQDISLMKETLTNTTRFLNLPINKKRLKCVLKHNSGMFRRERRCLKEPSDPEGIDYAKLNNTEIYNMEQKTRINLAIKNVNDIFIQHGYTSKRVLSYTNTSVKINVCTRKKIYQA